jgi:predicted metal-binding membrane protein
MSVGSTTGSSRLRALLSAGGLTVPVALLALAAGGWWWSARMAGAMAGPGAMAGMSGSTSALGAGPACGAFLVSWLAMMAAMMLPAVTPVVALYGRAAAQGRVAPLPFFVLAYLALWTAPGVPAYLAWRALMAPLAEGRPWAGRLAGLVLLAAAAWQLTPLKSACLRHCRSPLSFFLRFGAGAGRPLGAFRMGIAHAVFCLGCCWALMAVLVAFGTMQLAWMLGLAALILLEKATPVGPKIARAAAVAFVGLGLPLILHPALITAFTFGRGT